MQESEYPSSQSTDLLSTVQHLFSADVIQRLSQSLNEDSSRIKSGVDLTIPVILATIVKHFSGDHGASLLITTIKDHGGMQPLSVAATIKMGVDNQKLLAPVFREQLSLIIETVSQKSGLSLRATQTLLGIVTSLVFNVLGHKSRIQGFGPIALLDYLNRQKSSVLAALPSDLKSMINLESSHSKATTTKSSQWPAWLASVAAILILLIGGYTWMKNRFEHGARLQQLSIHEEQDPLSPNNSKQVSANWENNPEKMLTNKWFALFTSVNASNPKSLTLLGVNFESDSTTLSKQSDLPVYDLAEALQAFPNIRIRIDDITDSTGESSNNRKLSLARAMAVRAKLEQLGIEASRLEVKGFGELNPVATHKEGERSTSNPGLVVTVISEELPLAH